METPDSSRQSGLFHPLRHATLRFAILALAAAGIAAYAAFSHSRTLTLATAQQPEAYTELYFTHPDKLAKTAPASQSRIIEFTVHNLEGRTTAYPYAIYRDDQQIATGTITLNNFATSPVNQSLVIAGTKTRTMITVKLLNTGQSIHFWTEQPS
ncbi:MAG TPA: hypothetical protein VMT30_08120 [Candidatus Saccharimonadia bacterium]|nr:hypothetical protein [Candidatus Saccharimonadia bacterium]